MGRWKKPKELSAEGNYRGNGQGRLHKGHLLQANSSIPLPLTPHSVSLLSVEIDALVSLCRCADGTHFSFVSCFEPCECLRWRWADQHKARWEVRETEIVMSYRASEHRRLLSLARRNTSFECDRTTFNCCNFLWYAVGWAARCESRANLTFLKRWHTRRLTTSLIVRKLFSFICANMMESISKVFMLTHGWILNRNLTWKIKENESFFFIIMGYHF